MSCLNGDPDCGNRSVVPLPLLVLCCGSPLALPELDEDCATRKWNAATPREVREVIMLCAMLLADGRQWEN